jgi:hypothetical protein
VPCLKQSSAIPVLSLGAFVACKKGETNLQYYFAFEMPVLRVTYIYIYIYNYKGKAIPLQALTGPEGSRRLRLPDFMTIGT